MSGEFQKIDAAQSDIKKLQEGGGKAELQKSVQKYEQTFFVEVDHVQSELEKTEAQLSSPEAKELLMTTGPAKIAELLSKVAKKGSEMQSSKENDIATFEQLARELQTFLDEEKTELPNFVAIDIVEKENAKLETEPPTNDPDQLIQTKRNFLAKLPVSTKASTPYKEKVAQSIQDSITDLGILKGDHILIKFFNKNADEYAKLVRAFEQQPTEVNYAKIKTIQPLLDTKKLGDDIFNGTIDSSNVLISKLYQELWKERFKPTESLVDNVNSRMESKEKILYSAQTEKMLDDIEKSQESFLRPKWESYYAELVGNQLNAEKPEAQTPEKKATFSQLEEGLLKALLLLKTTTSRFTSLKEKLDFNTLEKLTHTIEDIERKIHHIEVRRQSEKCRESFEKISVLHYIVLLNMEENGSIYRFNDTYEALSPEKQEEVRMAVNFIINRDKQEVQKQTSDAKLSLAKSTGNFDAIGQALGERSKDYVDALKALKDGKYDEALDSYQAYVILLSSMPEQELSPDEKSALKDAQEKVNLLHQSADYFEAFKKLKADDQDGAVVLLHNYLKQIQAMGKEAQQLHAEQVNGATETIKFLSQKKVSQLQDLLSDVCEWKRAQITDQIDHGPIKHQVAITGPEVILIEEAIVNLRFRIEKGEILDFAAEFEEIKKKVTSFNQQNSIKPEENIMDKLSGLYEKLNSADPSIKKEATLEFAQELRDIKSYPLARKYLDKVLEKDPEYLATAATISKEKILQSLLEDPKIMQSIRAEAQAHYAKLKQENPNIVHFMTPQQAENNFITSALEKKYAREVRESMTQKRLAKIQEIIQNEPLQQDKLERRNAIQKLYSDSRMPPKNKALDLYNDWSPYKKADHFWQEGHFDAETYDEFKNEAAEFTAMTLATLPVGFLAGKAFTAGAGCILRASAGPSAREAAMIAFSRGGLAALKPGTAAFEALEPAVQQIIIHNQPRLFRATIGAFAGGLAVETGVMGLGNTIAEGFVSGHGSEVTSASLAENLIQVVLFKGIGKLGLKLFGKSLQEPGGLKKAAALLGMETLSGVGGLGVAAATLYAGGKGDQVDTAFILKNLLQSAFSSAGMHLGEGVVKFAAPGKRASKADRALEKALRDIDIDTNKPDSISSARITPDDPYIDDYEIKRPNRENLGTNFHALPQGEAIIEDILRNILKNENLQGFISDSESDRQIIARIIKYKKYSRRGITGDMPPPTDAEMDIYQRALRKMKECPATYPYFAIKDESDSCIYYLCVESGRSIKALKDADGYHILSELPPDSESQIGDIEKRIQILSGSKFFPQFRVINRNGSFYIATKFISHTSEVKPGTDVTPFVNFCKEINFGPDTNASNFIPNGSQLIYVDGDMIDWLKDPASQPYRDGNVSKTKTW